MTWLVLAALYLALEAHLATHHTNQRIHRMSDKYDDLLAQLNAGTNAVAARLDALTAQVAADAAKGNPPSADQLKQFADIATHLAAMGTDPANPVPAPAPTPAPADPSATPSA